MTASNLPFLSSVGAIYKIKFSSGMCSLLSKEISIQYYNMKMDTRGMHNINFILLCPEIDRILILLYIYICQLYSTRQFTGWIFVMTNKLSCLNSQTGTALAEQLTRSQKRDYSVERLYNDK